MKSTFLFLFLSLSLALALASFFLALFFVFYILQLSTFGSDSVWRRHLFFYIYIFFFFCSIDLPSVIAERGGKTKMKYNRMRIAVLSVRVLFPTGMFTCDREVSFRCRAALCGRRLARRLARLCRSSLIRLLLAVISSADCIEGE